MPSPGPGGSQSSLAGMVVSWLTSQFRTGPKQQPKKGAPIASYYGRESRDRRLATERETRIAEYERHLAEMREKAEGGDLRAQGFYARHWAMREDYVEAHTWYSIATARAPETWQLGLEQRDEIARKMTPEQLAEAERKARDWLDTHPAMPT